MKNVQLLYYKHQINQKNQYTKYTKQQDRQHTHGCEIVFNVVELGQNLYFLPRMDVDAKCQMRNEKLENSMLAE